MMPVIITMHKPNRCSADDNKMKVQEQELHIATDMPSLKSLQMNFKDKVDKYYSYLHIINVYIENTMT